MGWGVFRKGVVVKDGLGCFSKGCRGEQCVMEHDSPKPVVQIQTRLPLQPMELGSQPRLVEVQQGEESPCRGARPPFEKRGNGLRFSTSDQLFATSFLCGVSRTFGFQKRRTGHFPTELGGSTLFYFFVSGSCDSPLGSHRILPECDLNCDLPGSFCG